MTETLAHGYLPESTLRELSNEYQHNRVSKDGFQKSLHPCALDESSLSIGRVYYVGGMNHLIKSKHGISQCSTCGGLGKWMELWKTYKSFKPEEKSVQYIVV